VTLGRKIRLTCVLGSLNDKSFAFGYDGGVTRF
jgi:hypothetical protein